MSMSCSMISTVMAGSRPARSPAMRRDSAGDRPAVGSSSRSTRGRPASASAISSWRCSPWERFFTTASPTSWSPTDSSVARARAWRAAKTPTGRSIAKRVGVWAWTASRQFSSTVRSAKRLVIWKVRARPCAARACAEVLVTSRPKSLTVPAVTGSDPVMRLNSVVFPAPLGPISARRSPGRRASATSSTARRPPKSLVTPSSRSANSSVILIQPSPHRSKRALQLELPSTMLARGVVARVEGHLQELLGIVLPELTHRRVREDHGVLELAAHALDLADVDVLDGVAPLVDDDGTAREILQLDFLERGEQGLAVFDLAVDRLDGFHDPPGVRIAGLAVVGRHLARLGLERLHESPVGGVVECGRVVERGIHAERLVAHLRQHRLVGDRAVAEQRDLRLEPRVGVLLHELKRSAAEEDREDGVGVALDLGDERREVGRVQRRPDLLDDVPAVLLE